MIVILSIIAVTLLHYFATARIRNARVRNFAIFLPFAMLQVLLFALFQFSNKISRDSVSSRSIRAAIKIALNLNEYYKNYAPPDKVKNIADAVKSFDKELQDHDKDDCVDIERLADKISEIKCNAM